MIIGREKEIALLRGLLEEDQSQFVAVYGRRRVGKTFLIRESYNYNFTFQHTGIYAAPLKEQLAEFYQSLKSAGCTAGTLPTTWSEAFHLLERFIDSLKPDSGKKVIFIDEMPWMDTHKSGFVRSLDHFWNSWATSRRDIVLIVCGSATSWIINNVIMNYGGLHNRLTNQVYLEPFSLRECREYCLSRRLHYTDNQILEAYMVMGGIPYYWSFLKRGESVAQNIDRMFFKEKGELSLEFKALYSSLFKRPDTHIQIITALATRKMGMLRDDMLTATKLTDNKTFSTALLELEQCGFIRKYLPIGAKRKNAVYQLMDNYTLFYFDFIKENHNGDEHFWTSSIDTPLHHSWAGRAFERVCLQHLQQIKAALGFSAVISSAHSWVYRPQKNAEEGTKGAQIDLLIDRNDKTINLCEMKYSSAPYVITEEEDLRIRNRRAMFIRATSTRKTVLVTLITTYGLAAGGYSGDIPCQVTMKDLFK